MTVLQVISSTEALTHIALSGRLDVEGVGRIERDLSRHAAAPRRPAVVDLSGVEFIGSLGIGVLMSVARSLHLHGARMALLAPQDRVAQVLRESRVDQIMPIASSLDDALRLLGVPS
jgi:anti-anti-sigma factor